MKYLREALKRKKITIWFALLILVGGVYFYIEMPKQEFPMISSPGAILTIVYPGSSATEVEKEIVIPTEENLTFLNGIEYISSYSMENVGVIVVYLNSEVDPLKEWDRLRIRLNDLEQTLPPGAYIHGLNTDLVDTSSMVFAVLDEGGDYAKMKDTAQELKSDLFGVSGIKRIDVSGEHQTRVHIELNSTIMNQSNITVEDIYQLVLAQTTEIPIGGVIDDNETVKLTLPANAATIEELEGLVVGSNEFGVITLGDIASIQFEVDAGLSFSFNTKSVVLLSVYFENGVNTIPVGKEVKSIISDYKFEHPGTNIYTVLDSPNDVSTSIGNFMMNLIQSVLIVVVVVLIGMSFRNTVVVAIAIPLTIAGTFMIMTIFGVYIEQVSIAALIISLGILVDNSIVISSAIQSKLDQGINPFEAAFKGVEESMVPVLTATLTTIASFLPLIFLPGEAGQFVRSLPIVVSIAIAVSYIIAIFISPMFAMITFKPKSKNKITLHKKTNSYMQRGIEKVLKFRLLIVLLALGLFGGSFYLVMNQPIKMFPAAEKQMFFIDVKNDKNSLAATNELIDEIETILLDTSGIQQFTSSVGGGLPKFYPTVLQPLENINNGQILVEINFDDKVGEEFVFDLQTRLDAELTMGRAIVSEFELTQPGAPISIRIASTDEARLIELNDLIIGELESIPGTLNVSTSKPDYIKQIVIETNDLLLLQNGITKIEIQKQLNEAILGKELNTFIDGEEKLTVLINSNLNSITDLEEFGVLITNPQTGVKSKIELGSLAAFTEVETLETIQRINQERSIEIDAYVAPGYGAQNISREIIDKIEDMDTNEINIYYGGEEQAFDRYIKDIGGIAIIAVIVIYMIMFLQFKTFTQPLVILMTIPLSFIGTFIAIYLFDLDLSFTMGLGMASLMGIVVNNGILLIEYINRAREEGMGILEACSSSVVARFRPIMISSITTICGLIPLAINGGDFFKPLAIALMGGLTLSTLLTLLIVPSMYLMVSKIEQ